MKKINSNVISNENFYMILFIISLLFIFFILFHYKTENTIINSPSEKIIIRDTNRESCGWTPSWPYTNFFMKDPLINPYAPPLRDERYFIPSGAFPINVSTSIGAVDTVYRQLGLLTPLNGSSKDSILPLMGRPLFTNRDKWNYYSTSNQHNNIKLPLIHKGKNCTNEYGCDKIFTGDIVYIEGVNERYKVTMYENDTIRYLPSI